jgi:ubiquitin-like domain-containing CTD phosphatase 1
MKRHVDGTAAAEEPLMEDDEVTVNVTWSGSVYPVEIPRTSTVSDLKAVLFELTEVLPKRQKVIGIPRERGGPAVSDGTVLSSLPFKLDHKLMLIGTREADISAIQAYEASAAAACAEEAVVNDLDLDVDYSGDADGDAVIRYQESNRNKLNRRVASTEIRIINPPRAGKKLLVLDLDLTLFDTKGMQTTPMSELARPGLHRFLACCYRNYDLVIWSQTSWRWLEAKLTELNMLMHSDYKLSFVLDRTSMFSITSRRGREERRHEVKALEIIWRKFPDGRFGAQNTVHIDDLSRNFALNPQSGLKILPYKHSQTTNAPATDRELYYLMRYLSLIAREDDFGALNHKHWKQYASVRACLVLGDDSDRALAELAGPSRPPPDSDGAGPAGSS